MKTWLAVIAALCLGVTAWALPPYEVTRDRGATREELRYREATAELQRAHGILVATRWSDSLSALVLETAVDGLALTHAPSPLVTPEGDAEWRSRTENHLASYPRRDPRMTVGIAFQPDRQSTLEGVLTPRFDIRTQYYAGERDGSPYCIVVHPYRYDLPNSALRNASTPEACGWFARYGAPSASIAAWLDAGAFEFASLGRLADLDPMVVRATTRSALPFGMGRPFERSIVVLDCLAGDAAACERTVTEPREVTSIAVDAEVAARSPMSHMASPNISLLDVRGSVLFSEWEAQFGEDAFASFWTSDQPVADAFRSAFGAELGPWMRDFTSDAGRGFRASPGVPASTTLWALLTVTLLSVVACYVAMRRRVG